MYDHSEYKFGEKFTRLLSEDEMPVHVKLYLCQLNPLQCLQSPESYQHLVCQNCKFILKDPHACEACNSIFCLDCVVKREIRGYPNCFKCGKSEGYKKQSLFVQMQDLKRLKFKCLFNPFGCIYYCAYENLAEHQINCAKQQRRCPTCNF